MIMDNLDINELPSWKHLKESAARFQQPAYHLKQLLNDESRLKGFSLQSAGFFYDFSRQRVDNESMKLLFALAEDRNITHQFKKMMSGEKINHTEDRAALHTAARSYNDTGIEVDGKNVLAELKSVRTKIKDFSDQVKKGDITGSTGKRFKHLVVIGIGGSYLGTEFVSEALYVDANDDMHIHYLSNVDIHNFGRIVSIIDPETTLWIVISKSYTTAETLANENLARVFMMEKGIDPSKHFITVTAKGSPGDMTSAKDDSSRGILASFHMFDFIGGRYSVSSAVGGVPLSLYLGYDKFERFLKGAEEMDQHAASASPRNNMPLIAALLSVWNNNFLGYPATAIIPYAAPLSKLAPHIQQLNMESNGKSVTIDGTALSEPTGGIIFGEPGTNAQHSFFQLAHQGRPFPIEFIGVISPQYNQFHVYRNGVTNHQELWANLLSQPMALALGKKNAYSAKQFSGNRPSSTMILPDLSPESVGKLLSFYEAKTVFEAFIWGINPFDQFGVELGKQLAKDIRTEMAEKNANKAYSFDTASPIVKHYLKMLSKNEITSVE
jgi:glucose-6-phosphate isomerase